MINGIYPVGVYFVPSTGNFWWVNGRNSFGHPEVAQIPDMWRGRAAQVAGSLDANPGTGWSHTSFIDFTDLFPEGTNWLPPGLSSAAAAPPVYIADSLEGPQIASMVDSDLGGGPPAGWETHPVVVNWKATSPHAQYWDGEWPHLPDSIRRQLGPEGKLSHLTIRNGKIVPMTTPPTAPAPSVVATSSGELPAPPSPSTSTDSGDGAGDVPIHGGSSSGGGGASSVPFNLGPRIAGIPLIPVLIILYLATR